MSQNRKKVVLDFFGTDVSSEDLYRCADGETRPLIDILRDDGVLEKEDGTLIRAATNVPVDDPLDQFIWAVTGQFTRDGHLLQTYQTGKIRLGTRLFTAGGRDMCVAEVILEGRGVITERDTIKIGDGDPMPFPWVFSHILPRPEEYILQRSGVTLEDIYGPEPGNIPPQIYYGIALEDKSLSIVPPEVRGQNRKTKLN